MSKKNPYPVRHYGRVSDTIMSQRPVLDPDCCQAGLMLVNEIWVHVGIIS